MAISSGSEWVFFRDNWAEGEQNFRWALFFCVNSMRQQSNRGGKKPSESPHFFDHITYKGGGTIMYTLQAALTVSVCEVFREIINVCRQKWVEKNSSKSSTSLCCVETILMVDEKPLGYNTNIPPWFDVNQHISNLLIVKFFFSNIRFPKNINCLIKRKISETSLRLSQV